MSAWCLRAVTGPARIPLTTTGTTLLGRGMAGVEDKRVSRRHATLAASITDSEPTWAIEAFGGNPVVVRRQEGPTCRPLSDCDCPATCNCHLRDDAVVLGRGAAPLTLRRHDRLFLLLGQLEFVLAGPELLAATVPAHPAPPSTAALGLSTAVPCEQPLRAPEASIMGAPKASILGAPEASILGSLEASILGAPEASILRAHEPSAPGAPGAPIPGAPGASILGAPEASIPGAPEVSIPGAPEASIPGAPPPMMPPAPPMPLASGAPPTRPPAPQELRERAPPPPAEDPPGPLGGVKRRAAEMGSPADTGCAAYHGQAGGPRQNEYYGQAVSPRRREQGGDQLSGGEARGGGEAASGGGGGGGGGDGGGDGDMAGGSSAGAPGETSVWARDWEGLPLPRFTQPPKPAAPAGLRALEQLAFRPADHPSLVFFTTQRLVVAYDAYPKARLHLLILPRQPLPGPADLTGAHAPLLAHMRDLASWLSAQLSSSITPNLPPLRIGFHAVPSMRQLHLHLISSDLDSPHLKTKKHFNSFATDFFIPPDVWIRQLEAHGRLRVDAGAAEAGLKREMRCFLTGRPIRNVPELKAHLASPAFAAAIAQERRRG